VVGKTLVELPVALDNTSSAVNKSLTSSTNITEVLLYSADKQLISSLVTTEIVAISTQTSFTSTTIPGDLINKTVNPTYNILATTADSGLINNQGYFAGTYVIPGYVGTNTNFT
jgi:hypothetical protein